MDPPLCWRVRDFLKHETYSRSVRFPQGEDAHERTVRRSETSLEACGQRRCLSARPLAPQSMAAVYFTLEKSAGMRISLPSCRLTTNTDWAVGSKLS